MRAARLHEYTEDMADGLTVEEVDRPEARAGDDHHVVGYGGHIHEPPQVLVDGEFAYRGNTVGRYTELQELVALVDRGDVTLHTSRCDLGKINAVAEKLEHHEIDGRAVITP